MKEDVVGKREGEVENGYNHAYSISPARRMMGGFGLGFDDG